MISPRKFSILILIVGSIGISFGGLIMRNMNDANAWNVIFYRALGFIFSFTVVLIYRYKKYVLKTIKETGLSGIIGGLLLMSANLLFIQSFANTSIANTLFTISSIPFLTALLAFILLKEKVSIKTILMMIISFFGILLMIKDGLDTDGFYGNIMALGCAISFSGFVIVLRKSRNIDMMPASLISAFLLVVVSFFMNTGDIDIPIMDIILCFLWGALLQSFMNAVFIFTTRYLYAYEVTFFMLLESSLGPFWVWLFLDETLSKETLLGGIIVMLGVAMYSISEGYRTKKNYKLSKH
mgnify:FL=1